MIVKEILDYTIRNKEKMYLKLNQQLLIYIRGKSEVEKSRVVKAIKIGFVLLGKRNELVIFMPTSFAINEISKSIVYTTIKVNI